MPLSNDSTFGVRPLTEAINRLPATPTIIRELGIFKPDYRTTTYVQVAARNGQLVLVEAVPRGTPGMPVKENYGDSQTFNMLHLPKNDIVLADDVQNVKAWGSENTAMTVADKVNDKLAAMKADIEFTREHLMLGALMGKLLNADGTTVLEDIYQRFGLKRAVHNVELSDSTAQVGKFIDQIKTAQGLKRGGEMVNGWIVLASPAFMQELIYHPTIVEIYSKYQEARVYRDGNTSVSFSHMNMDFVQYDHVFPNGVQIPDGEAILLPNGTTSTFREYFAPANFSSAVNTRAQPYYASRVPMKHDMGWELHAQSNPLPLVLRPELVATLKME